MFSNSAYEALYSTLGLMAHSEFVKIITSQAFFKGLILIIFGFLFITTLWKYVSRHISGNMAKRYNVPLSQFVKITIFLILGLSVLKVGTEKKALDYQRASWSQNQYISERYPDLRDSYEVSFVFDIITTSIDEVARFITVIVDSVFGSSKDGYTNGANKYAKSIMYASTAAIDDPKLRSLIEIYTDRCIQKLFPQLLAKKSSDGLSAFMKSRHWIDQELGKLPLSSANGIETTCLDLKNDVRESLKVFAENFTDFTHSAQTDPETKIRVNHVAMSSAIANFYKEKREGYWGMHNASMVPGTAGKVMQHMNRFFSWDAVLSIFSAGEMSDTHGAAEAARRAQKFSDFLSHAPHIRGFAIMTMTAFFPWLVFLIVAFGWKVLIKYSVIYASIASWPIFWTLIYHVVQNLTQSGEALHQLGLLSDGISLTASKVVTDRIYYVYSVAALIQTLVPVATTGTVLFFLRPGLSDSGDDSKPEFIDKGLSTASSGVGLATGAMPKGG